MLCSTPTLLQMVWPFHHSIHWKEQYAGQSNTSNKLSFWKLFLNYSRDKKKRVTCILILLDLVLISLQKNSSKSHLFLHIKSQFPNKLNNILENINPVYLREWKYRALQLIHAYSKDGTECIGIYKCASYKASETEVLPHDEQALTYILILHWINICKSISQSCTFP